jgi:hypothetical protein
MSSITINKRIGKIAAAALATGSFITLVASARTAPTPKAPAADYWAFRPLTSKPLPKVKSAASVRTPVDAFILSALEAKGLTLSPPVDRRKLIRRISFDLLGLPPTPAEVEAFVADPDPHAYEKLVDRLLASPHYGERWARHWLDLARYADSDGQEGDEDRPTAYHYRDFVIHSLNDDLPYNTFVQWQLAGDEYSPDNPLAVAATGFLTAGPHAVLGDNLMEEEKVRERYNELDDILSTTGQTFLGMTFGCARCHDHKYDPIPTRDYYRMLAAFNTCDRTQAPLLHGEELSSRRKAEADWKDRLESARKELASWLAEQRKPFLKGNMKDADYRPLFSEAQRARWDALAAAVKTIEYNPPPSIPTALAMADSGPNPRESWLLDRGDFHRRKEPVQLGFLSILCRNRPPSAYWEDAKAHGGRKDTSYQRRAMADWMTDTEHGAGTLLARVIVNRIWQGHFGEGLVRTVNDFGKRCDGPSHPELLEWLASELVRGGWKLKPIHRSILLSAAYRQGTDLLPQAAKIDPENRLLWRRTPRRIESEIFRDSMLAVAGSLNAEMYGRAFKPPIQSEAILARNVQGPYPQNLKDTPETRRRSIYLFHKRVTQYPLFQAFDGPDASASCGRRNITTVPTQALAVLNEPFIRLRAIEFARQLQAEGGADVAAQVQTAYRLALGRMPSSEELAAGIRFLQKQSTARSARDSGQNAKLLALADYAQVIFGLNEFLYVD